MARIPKTHRNDPSSEESTREKWTEKIISRFRNLGFEMNILESQVAKIVLNDAYDEIGCHGERDALVSSAQRAPRGSAGS